MIRYRRQSGKHMLILSFTGCDPEPTSVGSKSRSAAVSCHIVMCYRYPGGPTASL
jgi:hypothetical protein